MLTPRTHFCLHAREQGACITTREAQDTAPAIAAKVVATDQLAVLGEFAEAERPGCILQAQHPLLGQQQLGSHHPSSTLNLNVGPPPPPNNPSLTSALSCYCCALHKGPWRPSDLLHRD